MKRLLLLFIIPLVFASCKVYTYKSGHSAIPTVSINTNIEADVEVDKSKTLTGFSQTKVVLGIFKTEDNMFSDAFGGGVGDKEKKAATYKALENTDFDILVNPKYIVKVENRLFVKKVSVNVVGYGGKIILK